MARKIHTEPDSIKTLWHKKVVISLVQKAEDITWQKDKWLTNFPANYRLKNFYENEPLPGGLYTTPNMALRYELESTYQSIKWYEDEKAAGMWSADHEIEYNGELKLIKLIKPESRDLKTLKREKAKWIWASWVDNYGTGRTAA